MRVCSISLLSLLLWGSEVQNAQSQEIAASRLLSKEKAGQQRPAFQAGLRLPALKSTGQGGYVIGPLLTGFDFLRP